MFPPPSMLGKVFFADPKIMNNALSKSLRKLFCPRFPRPPLALPGPLFLVLPLDGRVRLG